METIIVKVVEEAGAGAATGDSSTSPEGPKKMGLETGGDGVGVGSIRGGVNPWWLRRRVGRTTMVGGYWAMGRAILGFKKIELCCSVISAPRAGGGAGMDEAASASGGRVASDKSTTLRNFFEYMMDSSCNIPWCR